MYGCVAAELTEILAAAGVLLIHPKEAEAGRRLVPTKRLLRVSECMRSKMSGWFYARDHVGEGKTEEYGNVYVTVLWLGHACAFAESDSKTTGVWAVARDVVHCGRARRVFQGYESLHARVI